jgi:hypothetical protein
VIGGPARIPNDWFDVVARAEGEATPGPINVMIRLLADQFGPPPAEMRELPAYYLGLEVEPGVDLWV